MKVVGQAVDFRQAESDPLQPLVNMSDGPNTNATAPD
jgi:hypothetical protein